MLNNNDKNDCHISLGDNNNANKQTWNSKNNS